ncbi:MAG: HD domain-containing phosphohydrolase [Candidatus Tectomicrobia bacterium]
MSAVSLVMKSALGEESISHGCLLVAPPEVVEVAYNLGIEFTDVSAYLPVPPPSYGLVVCLPNFLVEALPSGWTGVWACPEAPPPGSWVPVPVQFATDLQALGRALQTAATWLQERQELTERTGDREATLKTLNEIGIAVSAERDAERLLTLILSRARQLVAADAGSLYLLQEDENGHEYLLFALAQNDSVDAPWQKCVLPLTPHSMAGSVAQSGQVVVVEDVYAPVPHGTLRHDKSFDERFGYRTRSVVGIPLLRRDNTTLGVLQLINRKPAAGIPLAEPTLATEVRPFSQADVELLRSLASLAAISLENSELCEEISRLFEGFVGAAVKAIEQRDPTTSGHSFRVAEGTLALARRVERLERGPWAGARFTVEELRALRYAALLHDFGKVGVREKVLIKACKLYDDQLAALEYRFQLAVASRHASRMEEWLYAALEEPHGTRQRLPQLFDELDQEKQQIETMLRTVHAANQPNITSKGDFSVLESIHRWQFVDPAGTTHMLLTAEEMRVLSISRGTLTPQEREEISSHVTHSYNFLRTSPWTRDLKRVPEIAYAHHEKLDGSGYPRGLVGDEIPLAARMMTIADIFDALTASDRPYKKAVPLEHALNILHNEARAGQLDASLVELWTEAHVWEDFCTPYP